MARKVITVARPRPATWRLFFAIDRNDLAKAKIAIDDGADVNHLDEPKVPNPYHPSVKPEDIAAPEYGWRGTTPLTLACRYGRVDFIRLLVEHGARLDLRDRWRELPLDVAHERHPGIVELLVSLGAQAKN
jgi:ankyrin repeat protein